MGTSINATPVVPSNTNLIGGIAKVVQTTTSATNQVMTSSVNLALTVPNVDIRVGMILSGTGIPANGAVGYPVMIERVISGNNFTLNYPITIAANVANITYDYLNQGQWKSYGIMIGDCPGIPATTASAFPTASNVAGQAELKWRSPNLNVKAGMSVSGAGIAAGTTIATVDSTTSATLSINIATTIPDDTVLTFAYTAVNTITVTTIDNIDVTITDPPQDVLLPLQVAQVWASSQNVSNITAYENDLSIY